MHRSEQQAPERGPAVPADRLGTKQLVLRATRRVGREPDPDAGDRPPVHQAAVLRNAEGPGTLRHQSKEGSAAHASARPQGRLSEAIDQPPGSWPQGLPVFTAEYGDYEARPGLGERHHLHPVAARLPLPDGRDGPLQPQRAVVAALQHADGRLLLGGAQRRWSKLAQRSSIRIKGPSSRRPPSRADWKRAAWPSRWTVAAEPSTTCSSKGSGAPSSTRRSTYQDYVDGWQAEKSLGKYFDFYRDERPHQALGYRTPSEVYAGG